MPHPLRSRRHVQGHLEKICNSKKFLITDLLFVDIFLQEVEGSRSILGKLPGIV